MMNLWCWHQRYASNASCLGEKLDSCKSQLFFTNYLLYISSISAFLLNNSDFFIFSFFVYFAVTILSWAKPHDPRILMFIKSNKPKWPTMTTALHRLALKRRRMVGVLCAAGPVGLNRRMPTWNWPTKKWPPQNWPIRNPTRTKWNSPQLMPTQKRPT